MKANIFVPQLKTPNERKNHAMSKEEALIYVILQEVKRQTK